MVGFFKALIQKMSSSQYDRAVISLLADIFFFFTCLFLIGFDAIYPLNLVGRGAFLAFVVLSGFYFAVFDRSRLKIVIFVGGILAIIFMMIISTIANGFSSFPLTPISTLVLSTAVFLWCSRDSKNIKKYYVLLITACGIFGAIVLVTCFNDLISPNIESRSFGSVFGNANDLARKLCFCTLLFLSGFFKWKRKVLFLLSFLAGIVTSYMIILTGSLSNFLFLILTWLLCLLFGFGKKKWMAVLLLLILICLFVLLINVPQFSYFKNRLISFLNDFGNAGSGGSTNLRVAAAISGLRLFIQRPLFGYGYSGVSLNYAIMSHNNIVELLADFGLLCALAFELILIIPFFRIKRVSKQNKFLVVATLTYLFLNQFFLVEFDEKADMIFIGFLYACLSENDYFFSKSLFSKRKFIIKFINVNL